MRKPLVAGNWKMNGDRAHNDGLLEALKSGVSNLDVDVVVCPPSVYVMQALATLHDSDIATGSQDASYHEEGAFTGDISMAMLKDLDVAYVLVGHSERREYHGETNDLVALKCHAALEQDVTPIVCVGESLQQREQGLAQTVIGEQVHAVVTKLGIHAMEKTVIAYEPIWAIGTGLTASPQQAQEIHAYIRGLLASQDASVAQKVRILYGGSVKPDNASELFAMPDIDGGLVGGASLDATAFIQICKAAG
jgi:triosephosphate isomerase